MTDTLTALLRNAGWTMIDVAHLNEEYAKYTEGITEVMS